MSQDKLPFREPKITLNKIYTKTGDKGSTALVGGQRLPKSHPRIDAYGTVDELNAFIGRALESSKQDLVAPDFELVLTRIQHELFNLGSLLATLPEDIRPQQATINQGHITQLEQVIDTYNKGLPPLKSFILPGGSRLAADLHICRTVCRRAERLLQGMAETEQTPELSIIYLNRLSDAFFVFSRWAQKQQGLPEYLWDPNK